MSEVVNSPVYRAGDWYIISGITGRVGEQLVGGGFEPEFRRALERLQDLLSRHRLALSDVAKVNIYLRDMGNRTRMNELYLQFFGSHLPARTVVGVAEISREGAVEIEGWAYKPA